MAKPRFRLPASPSYQMEPAKPPLPTPRKRWFQSFSGSQTSKRISESAEGRSNPVTRQNGGQFMQRLVDTGTTQIAGSHRFRHGDGCIWELEMLEGGAVGGVENRW